MPATALSAAQQSAAEISARVLARRDQAAAEWRALARLAAETGAEPDADAVAAVGGDLGLSAEDARREFARDAAAVRDYPVAVANAENLRRLIDDKLAAHGGWEGLQSALNDAEHRFVTLQRDARALPLMEVEHGRAAGLVRQLRERHPRVFEVEG